MRVKMLRDFGKFQRDTVQEVSPKVADILVKRGHAELLKEPKPTQRREKKD